MKTYYSIPLIAVFAVSLFLLACKKKDSFMDVGKYQLIKYSTYPNGTKDTLYFIGYGPRCQPGTYYFDIKGVGTNADLWTIYNEITQISLKDAGSSFNIISYSKTATSLEISFSPNYDFPVGDSASGIITFNRISL